MQIHGTFGVRSDESPQGPQWPADVTKAVQELKDVMRVYHTPLEQLQKCTNVMSVVSQHLGEIKEQDQPDVLSALKKLGVAVGYLTDINIYPAEMEIREAIKLLGL